MPLSFELFFIIIIVLIIFRCTLVKFPDVEFAPVSLKWPQLQDENMTVPKQNTICKE